MADETFAEALFPSRLTSADLAQIETETQQRGRTLLAAALAAQPSRFSADHWMQQASEWATQDDELKVRLFRLVDCMPMLDDPVALDRHVREYLSEDVIERLPGGLRTALQAARSGILAPLAARAVRGATLAQARRFIAGTNPAEAAQTAFAERKSHRGFTLDLLGEAVTSEEDADGYATAYERLLVDLSPVAARWPADPRIDRLREKMIVREDKNYTRDYHGPRQANHNAVQVFFKDGGKTPKVDVEFLIGDARRRTEAMPLLERKFRNNLAGRYSAKQCAAVTQLLTNAKRLQATPVNEFMDLLAV
jgi:hypothetical protein